MKMRIVRIAAPFVSALIVVGCSTTESRCNAKRMSFGSVGEIFKCINNAPLVLNVVDSFYTFICYTEGVDVEVHRKWECECSSESDEEKDWLCVSIENMVEEPIDLDLVPRYANELYIQGPVSPPTTINEAPSLLHMLNNELDNPETLDEILSGFPAVKTLNLSESILDDGTWSAESIANLKGLETVYVCMTSPIDNLMSFRMLPRVKVVGITMIKTGIYAAECSTNSQNGVACDGLVYSESMNVGVSAENRRTSEFRTLSLDGDIAWNDVVEPEMATQLVWRAVDINPRSFECVTPSLFPNLKHICVELKSSTPRELDLIGFRGFKSLENVELSFVDMWPRNCSEIFLNDAIRRAVINVSYDTDNKDSR